MHASLPLQGYDPWREISLGSGSKKIFLSCQNFLPMFSSKNFIVSGLILKYLIHLEFIFVLCCSVAKPCLTVCDPMDCSTPSFPVLHYLPEFAQTHVDWVNDAIQPSHPLLFPSPPAFYISQHQVLFQCVGFLHQMAKVLGLQLQQQSFQWIFRVDFLWDWLIWSPCCPRDSQESPAQQFKSFNSLVLSLLYGPASTSVYDYWEIIALIMHTFVGKVMFLLFNVLSRFVIVFLSRTKCL